MSKDSEYDESGMNEKLSLLVRTNITVPGSGKTELRCMCPRSKVTDLSQLGEKKAITTIQASAGRPAEADTSDHLQFATERMQGR